MHAQELLKRYKAGERNFQQLDLRGAKFQGENLVEADFSECDLRGANFEKSDLTGAIFFKAKAGLQRRWAIVLVIPALTTVGMLCIFSAIFTGVVIGFATDIEYQLLEYTRSERIIILLIATFFYLNFGFVSIRKGILSAFGMLAAVVAIIGIIAITGASLITPAVVAVLALVLIGLNIGFVRYEAAIYKNNLFRSIY